MYNRYIGNTGKFYRVEDVDAFPLPPPEPNPDRREVLRSMEEVRKWEEAQIRTEAPPHVPPLPERPQPPPQPEPPPPYYPPDTPRDEKKEPPHAPPPPPPNPEEASKFDFGKVFQMPGTLRQTVRDWLPAGLDLGDILLVLVLLYLFLEGDDDDMLIILGILLFTWIRPLFKKEEEPG